MSCSSLSKHLASPLFCLATLLGVPHVATANPAAPTPAFQGGPHDMLFGVSTEGKNGIAVGDFGLVVETRDGGKTWLRQEKIPTDLGLFAVVMKSGKCIAAGQQGTILMAADCRQWIKTPPPTNARILAVDVDAQGTAYAVGGFGTVLKSQDWGKSWVTLKPDWAKLTSDGAEPHLYDVHLADDGSVTVVGEFELVMRSRDGGISWTALHNGRRSLFALKVMDDGGVYAVGQEGLILKSGDGGHGWTEMQSGTHSILTGIWARPEGQILVSGVYTILHSDNSGKSWRMDDSKLARNGWHQAAAGFANSKGLTDIFLVGSGGAILSVQR